MEKKRLVILGSGFGALSVLKKIDLGAYDVTVISARNHFLFTPLLPSTTVGTIEFRSIIEPVRKARKGVTFELGTCTAIDLEKHVVTCDSTEPGVTFNAWYEILVIAVGMWSNTFHIPGVVEHAVFLKEAQDARTIRERIISCLERADVPGITDADRDRLLNFLVVGGGPTGVEFAAELHDLFEEELARNYPNLKGKVKITLYEAGKTILTSFDAALRDYTIGHFKRQGIELKLETPVAEVGDGFLKLKNGEIVPSGLIVWSTGNSPNKLIESLPFERDKAGRVLTDEFLRASGHNEVYMLGDCATIVGTPLPQTAQLAMQEGKYLADALNKRAHGKTPESFRFKNLGMLAYVGESKALADIPKANIHARGASTYFFWRAAYITRLVSLKNKILVLFDWFKTWVFGRDLSKF